MVYTDLINQLVRRKEKPEMIQNVKAESLLEHLLEKKIINAYHTYGFDYTNNLMESIVYGKGLNNDEELYKILEQNGFNFSCSIRNSIYYLFSKERKFKLSPLNWPGMEKITQEKSKYQLDTRIGKLEVYKASSLFEKTTSKCIFDRKLIGNCHYRTYEFLEKNHDYEAVLSYMPSILYGGGYHSYLEKDDEILDIAANAYYYCEDSAKKVLNGEIIKKLSYDEVEDTIEVLVKEMPKQKQIIKDNKLSVLSIYYDIINGN